MDNRNFTLLTDFYELTMMQGYFENHANETVVFDLFYRQNPDNGGYAVCAWIRSLITSKVCILIMMILTISGDLAVFPKTF